MMKTYQELYYTPTGEIARTRYPYSVLDEDAPRAMTAEAQAEMWENTFALCPSVGEMIAAVEVATGGVFAYAISEALSHHWVILWDGETRFGQAGFAHTREQGAFWAWLRYVHDPRPDTSQVLIEDRFELVCE